MPAFPKAWHRCHQWVISGQFGTWCLNDTGCHSEIVIPYSFVYSLDIRGKSRSGAVLSRAPPLQRLLITPLTDAAASAGTSELGWTPLQFFVSADGKRYCFSMVKDVIKLPFINKSVNFKN